tara:strand:+ start:15990 stop:16535 length:546 start_codon:yes stop_codon:yes gene_type:complete
MSKAAGYKPSFTVHTTSLTFFGLKQSHDKAFWRKLLEKQLFKLPTENLGDEEIEEAIDLANDHQSEAGHYLHDLQGWMKNENAEAYASFMWEAVRDLDIYGVTADIILGECIHADNEATEQIKAANAVHFMELSERLHFDCGDLDQIAKGKGVPISEIDMREILTKAGCSVLLANRLEDTD